MADSNIEISSVGARVRVAFETAPGVRPTFGYCDIPDINAAPEQDMSTETIDASNISDYVTRYIDGRQDPGGDQSFTLNHTDNVISVWDKLASDTLTKEASGLRLWFEYWFPKAKKSYFWAGKPKALGTSGIAQNELDTIPGHVVLKGWEGWKAKSGVAADKRAVTVSVGGTVVVNIYDYSTTPTATSAATGTATSTAGTAYQQIGGLTVVPVTITGVAVGTTTVTIADGANSFTIDVTVEA